MERLSLDNIQTKEEETVFNGEIIHNETIVNIDEVLDTPPTAISIQNETLVTYGNFCCLVGASKSMKSFFKSALLACYVGGKSQNYFDDIKGHDTKGKYVIDVDTEQGKYHVQKVARRTTNMIGSVYGGYKAFALRPRTAKERVQFIDWLFKESDYKGKIGLLSIDGAADLLDNVNDLEASNEITQKLMSWSSENDCAIITVIHRNFDSNKPTGHLGSAILKKSESVVFINKNEDIVEVAPKYTRNMPFDSFTFTLDENSLPIKTGVQF